MKLEIIKRMIKYKSLVILFLNNIKNENTKNKKLFS